MVTGAAGDEGRCVVVDESGFALGCLLLLDGADPFGDGVGLVGARGARQALHPRGQRASPQQARTTRRHKAKPLAEPLVGGTEVDNR